jgi:hypothetical protein
LHDPLQQIPAGCGDVHAPPVGMQQSGTPDAEVHVDPAQQPMLMQDRSGWAQQLPFSQLYPPMPQSLACVQPYGVQTPTGDCAFRTQRTLAPQHVFGKPPLQ